MMRNAYEASHRISRENTQATFFFWYQPPKRSSIAYGHQIDRRPLAPTVKWLP
jgi:hypothetical protein